MDGDLQKEHFFKEEHYEKIEPLIPYFGLAVSVALALGIGPWSPAYVGAVLVLSVIAAGWMAWMVGLDLRCARVRQRRMAVYYPLLMLLIGGLVALSPLFGFFAFTGYLHAGLLAGRWKTAGVVATAFLLSTTQMGGIGNIRGMGVAVYGGLVLVNVVIAGSLFNIALMEEARSHRRGLMVEQLAEANRRLQETMEENAGLHAQLLVQAREAGVLDERQRMAGEIHDTLAQGLTGIVTQLEAAERAGADPQRRRRHLDLAQRLARESLAEARRSVQALRPGPLDSAHLPEAVGDLARDWSQTAGVPVRVEITGSPAPLMPTLEVVLFRTAQEALTNIAKHAGASEAGVTLSYTHDVVLLDILDNGTGFAAEGAEPGSGYGLTAMRQRLRQVGGTLEIESAPGEGTTISARVPAHRVQNGP